MRVAVFGANGPTGRLLVRLLADRGHEVLASTRHPGDFPLETEADTARRVSVVEVDAFQRQSVVAAVDPTSKVPAPWSFSSWSPPESMLPSLTRPLE